MKYAHIENNKLLGFYDSNIHKNIPEGSVEITDKEWSEALEIGANSYIDGKLTYVLPEDTRTYSEKRQAEYPPIEDYIDGIVKSDDVQVQNYINACLAVKAKYPKPEEVQLQR